MRAKGIHRIKNNTDVTEPGVIQRGGKARRPNEANKLRLQELRRIIERQVQVKAATKHYDQTQQTRHDIKTFVLECHAQESTIFFYLPPTTAAKARAMFNMSDDGKLRV